MLSRARRSGERADCATAPLGPAPTGVAARDSPRARAAPEAALRKRAHARARRIMQRPKLEAEWRPLKIPTRAIGFAFGFGGGGGATGETGGARSRARFMVGGWRARGARVRKSAREPARARESPQRAARALIGASRRRSRSWDRRARFRRRLASGGGRARAAIWVGGGAVLRNRQRRLAGSNSAASQSSSSARASFVRGCGSVMVRLLGTKWN